MRNLDDRLERRRICGDARDCGTNARGKAESGCRNFFFISSRSRLEGLQKAGHTAEAVAWNCYPHTVWFRYGWRVTPCQLA